VFRPSATICADVPASVAAQRFGLGRRGPRARDPVPVRRIGRRLLVRTLSAGSTPAVIKIHTLLDLRLWGSGTKLQFGTSARSPSLGLGAGLAGVSALLSHSVLVWKTAGTVRNLRGPRPRKELPTENRPRPSFSSPRRQTFNLVPAGSRSKRHSSACKQHHQRDSYIGSVIDERPTARLVSGPTA
jgi:hypothetical protein